VTTIAAKPGAPVVGFNHNVKYGPRVYHVQTEDSGLPHAHYITHLFVGGNIVASLKTSYADKMGDPHLPQVVRALMEGQHKAMLKRLITGEFNEMAERLSAQHYEPGVLADGTHTASYVNTQASNPASAAAQSRAGTPSGGIKPVPRPPAPAGKPAPKPAPPQARPAPAVRPPEPTAWQPAPPATSPAAARRTPGQPLPPVTRAPAQPTRPTVPPRMAQVAAPAPARQGARPAAPLFSETPVETPTDDLPTLFAEELISEKSLDEVILAFLSADLDPPK
jgi:hypothetical protein